MSKKSILVVGGAGYIGSHMVALLVEQGYHVVVYDNLVSGHADAVQNVELCVHDLADIHALKKVFSTDAFTAVLHFAGFIQVGESVQDPAKYYQNNLINTLHLLETMRTFQVKHIIFSSTAAVYGEPHYTPLDIHHPLNPVNPYGKSKLMVEQVLQDYDRAYGIKYIALRYFNAAGADPQGRLGERHQPETHLIPLALQAVSKRGQPLAIFGRDYPTFDGTCIRDYIHVTDLCQAHLLALQKLEQEPKSAVYNLGNGTGFSVQQVMNVVEQVTGQKIPLVDAPRRSGDAAILVADAVLAKQELGWQPQFSALEVIVQHAWNWELKSFVS